MKDNQTGYQIWEYTGYLQNFVPIATMSFGTKG